MKKGKSIDADGNVQVQADGNVQVQVNGKSSRSRRSTRLLFLAQAGVIAALYVAMTHLSNAAGLASGVIQVRVSEALCVLAYFTPAAVPGMTVGCFLALHETRFGPKKRQQKSHLD